MQRVGELLKARLDRIIIENQMLKAGFAALPYAVMRDKDLSVGARLAYAFLLMYAWQEESCFAGQEKMAGDMGVSRAQVQRYLYELRDAAFIRIERRDKRFNNTYVILDRGPTKLKQAHRRTPVPDVPDASPVMRRMHHPRGARGIANGASK